MTEELPGRTQLALGAALREQGRFAEAREQLCEAAEVAPTSPEVHVQLGLTYLLAEQAAESVAHFERALTLDPSHRLALLNLGNARKNLGEDSEALALYQRSLEAGAPFATGHNNLGRTLQDLGRLDEAVEHYAKGLELEPENQLLLGNLASAHTELGSPGAMRAHCERSLEQRPRSVQLLLHLCVALRAEGRHDEATAAARRAVEADVDSAPAHFQLGTSLHEQGRVEDAEICFENALQADPEFAPARNSLAGTLNLLGKLDEALEHWERVVCSSPGFSVAFSNLMLCRNYSSDWSAEALRQEAERWGRRVEEQVGAPSAWPNDRDPERRLRVGYVSADLLGHPVASFFEPLLAERDRGAFEVTCYSCSPREDATTARLRALSDQWRAVEHVGDAALAERVRADGIDILVDLGGHTGGNRLPLFARKPAPVQATYIGYPGTTGLSRVDYRIVDAATDPEGSDADCTEELVRLPRCFLCFAQPDDAPHVSKLPPTDPDWFTFASLNNLAKVSPQAIAAWARILRGVPDSRLLMKNASLAYAPARARVEGLFAAHGISSRRLELMGRLGRQEHLALHASIGLHLDCFPYNGTATTCEAAWMGVPTLTLEGTRHAGRVGASLSIALGQRDLVCADLDAYVARAIALGSDPGALRALGMGLRERMRASDLCDRVGLARAVEASYRAMWRRWCGAQ